jgi:hypothetical protein
VLAKHSKNFSLEDSLAIGVDRMQRNFGPLKQQVEQWRAMHLTTAAAKLLIYQAFIEEESGFPKHLARRVHDLYFEPMFRHEPCGACRTHSPVRSRSWNQFLSTRQRRSSRGFCRRFALLNQQQKHRCAVPAEAFFPPSDNGTGTGPHTER